MNSYETQEKKRIDKLFKEAQNDLKTSFFSLKFSPDHLSAVVNFTDAAKSYRKIKLFREALKSFEEAIKCNKKLLEGWAEGQNYLEMAEIFLFDLGDEENGLKCLKNASYAIKITGKLSMSVKIYIEKADKLIENRNNQLALKILQEAFDDCKENTHDDLMRISLEEIFVKILDMLCSMEKFADAAEFIISYIKIQKNLKDEKKYKVSKNYLFLGLIRIIMNEAYLVDSIIDEMFSFYDNSCSDDIDDLKNSAKYFEEVNKAKIINLLTYSFSLFPNNLLKAFKKAYDRKEVAGISNQVRSINLNNVNISNNNKKVDIDETRDQTLSSYLGDDENSNIDNASDNNANNVNNNADNYL
jgi:tetratricopeptide (TPR) repeat protein